MNISLGSMVLVYQFLLEESSMSTDPFCQPDGLVLASYFLSGHTLYTLSYKEFKQLKVMRPCTCNFLVCQCE